MPKSLISEIRTGSIEMEDQDIDLEDLDQAYEQDLDKEEFKDQDQQTDTQSDTQNMQGGMPNVGQAPAIWEP